MKNKTDIYHVFSNGCDEYFTPAEGGQKAAEVCFKSYVEMWGCARMYYRAKGDDEENDGECIKSSGVYPQ